MGESAYAWLQHAADYINKACLLADRIGIATEAPATIVNMVKIFIPDGDATIVMRRKEEVVQLD